MVPGEAGEALTNSADSVGNAVTAGQEGNWGDMGTGIMQTAGATTAAAGEQEIGDEIRDWGTVAGNGAQAGIDNQDATQAITATLTDASNTAKKYQETAATTPATTNVDSLALVPGAPTTAPVVSTTPTAAPATAPAPVASATAATGAASP